MTNLDALDRYLWTGHAALLGHQCVPWQDTDFALARFGSPYAQARAVYRAFVVEGIAGAEPDLDGGLRRSRGLWEHLHPIRRGREAWSFDERILGDGAFVRAVLEHLNGRQAPPARQLDAAQLIVSRRQRIA